MIIAECLVEGLLKVETWKEKHTLEHGTDKDSVVWDKYKTWKDQCAVYRTWTGRNVFFCVSRLLWVYKKYSGINDPLRTDPEFKCIRCLGKMQPGRYSFVMITIHSRYRVLLPWWQLTAGGGCGFTAVPRYTCVRKTSSPNFFTSIYQPSDVARIRDMGYWIVRSVILAVS